MQLGSEGGKTGGLGAAGGGGGLNGEGFNGGVKGSGLHGGGGDGSTTNSAQRFVPRHLGGRGLYKAQ